MRTSSTGFTLIELLVAVAILTTVLSGVALVFASSLRMVQQGFQNQEAYEMARGALNIIERDLSRAYTDRLSGHVEHFYGTPIGFTFVGLVSPDERGIPNLARITYVVFPDRDAGLLESSTINPLTGDFARLEVFRLLRIVQFNKSSEDLDNFPVEWYRIRTKGDTGGFNVFNNWVGDLINAACACPNKLVLNDDGRLIVDVTRLTPAELTRVNTKKRELWIIMLAGGSSVDGVPSAWENQRFIEINGSRDARPGDYTVVENLVLDPDRLLNLVFETFGPSISARPFFRYSEYQPAFDPLKNDRELNVVPQLFWNDLRNVNEPGSPFNPRMPEIVNTEFRLFFESAAPGAPDFDRTFTQEIFLPTGFRRQPPA